MADPKRVIHLISPSGSWEPFVRVADLAAALREHGYASVVAAPDHSRLWEMAEAAGVGVVDHTLERSLNPLRWKELAAMIRQSGAGIVHAHDAASASLVSRAGIFMDSPGVVVSRYDLSGGVSGAEYGGRTDAVVCPSRIAADAYLAAGAAAEKVHVVFSGAKAAAAERSEEERARIRSFFIEKCRPGSEKPLFIVSIAPFDEKGGQEELIEAMPDLLAALPQARLFLMGEGPGRAELSRLIKLRAVGDEVALLEPDKAYHRLLAAADLYVAWAKDDCAGIMVQAAMAAGRGIVLRNSGCHGELAEDGVSGVFDAGGSVDSLRSAMLDVLGNRSRREKLGKQAKARAARLFDSKERAAEIAAVYGRITASRQ